MPHRGPSMSDLRKKLASLLWEPQALKVAADTILLVRHIKHPIAFKQALREDDYERALKHTDLTEEEFHDRVGSIRERATDLAEEYPEVASADDDEYQNPAH